MYFILSASTGWLEVPPLEHSSGPQWSYCPGLHGRYQLTASCKLAQQPLPSSPYFRGRLGSPAIRNFLYSALQEGGKCICVMTGRSDCVNHVIGALRPPKAQKRCRTCKHKQALPTFYG